ncbi:tannase and feruloyl esterase [Thozetella sp. PMI_491]|nr:tannase and feruloyl esterase [Thozetella sp. PMI_491]
MSLKGFRDSLPSQRIPGADVVSVSTAEAHGYMSASGVLDFCEVNITLTHAPAGDNVLIRTWLPLVLHDWNGRFQGTGGSGFVAGGFTALLEPGIANGYVASTTDAGLQGDSGQSLLNDSQLMLNFASLSIHEMTVVGKALTKAYFGKPALFSYFNGCSTGGRQGLMEAQKYPDDYDGILSIAPAINMPKFLPAELYPYVVMNQEEGAVSACVFDTLTAAQIAACDLGDGAEDGIIADPGSCTFNAYTMVGRPTGCQDASHSKISSAEASIFNRIFEGFRAPNGTRLWYGLSPGAPVTSLAAEPPFELPRIWALDFVLGEPDRNPQTLTYTDLLDIFAQSEARYGDILGTDDPDLRRVRDGGHKILSWHGLADPLIFPEGTLDYRRKVDAAMGGTVAVDEFYRVFEAPAVGHCLGGNGPVPDWQATLATLVAWVEHGAVPDTLWATTIIENITTTRNLCRYPKKQRYVGTGDVHDAASWTCV